jgi:hypothetical protein
MPAFAPPPRFHGIPVYVEFDPRISRPYVLFTAIHELVRHVQSTVASEDELLIRIHELVAEYGLVALLIALTTESIEFRVGKT